jgi:hypothetical protein
LSTSDESSALGAHLSHCRRSSFKDTMLQDCRLYLQRRDPHSIPDWALHVPYIHGLNISYYESNMCCWTEILWSLSENLMNLIPLYYWLIFALELIIDKMIIY